MNNNNKKKKHKKIFEEVGDKYMENKLTAPSAKELYFKASLLYLCNDVYKLI